MATSQAKAALQRLSDQADSTMFEFRDAIIEELCRLTDSEIAYFYATDLGEEHLTLLGYSKSVMKNCMIVDRPATYRVDETGLWGDAVRKRKPTITNDYLHTDNPSKHGLPEGHVPVRSHMNLPIFEGNRIVAIVGVGNKPTPYTETDVQHVRDLMDGIWAHFQEALWATVW
jgi:GAF domain-containing protein